MQRRILVTMVTSALAAVTLAACSSGTSTEVEGDTDEPYRVLVTAGLSAPGVLAANSETSALAVETAAELVNDNGGILGREVEVTIVDDSADATVAVTKLREAISSDSKPDLYLMSGPSQITAAALPILADNNILSMGIGPTEDSADASSYPLHFDLAASPEDYVRGFVPYLDQQGYDTVALIHGSSSYGQAFADLSESVFTESGIDLVDVQQYDVDALDMTPQLQSLQAENPDALIMDAYGGPVGYLLDGIEKLDWDIPIVANTSVSATGLISTEPPEGLLGDNKLDNLAIQVFTSTAYSPDDTEVNAVVEAMAGLGDIPSTLINAFNYDALPLIVSAADEVGGTDNPAELASALERTDVQDRASTAILSSYNFTSEAHGPNAGNEVFEFISPAPLINGQFDES